MLLFIDIYTFFTEKRAENVHFYSNMAWPRATYDVISRNQINRFLPNFAKLCLSDMKIATEMILADNKILLKI